MSKMDIVKKDGREVAKRVAVKTATRGVTTMLAKAISPGGTKKDASIRKNIEEMLMTDTGQAFVSILLGAAVPVLEDKIPEKHRKLANEIGQEARVGGEVVLTNKMIDQIAAPLFQGTFEGIKNALDGVIEAEEKAKSEVRAELPKPAQESLDVSEVEKLKATVASKKTGR